ncbi:MAG: Smr/MutS family protein [Acidobacteriota bacterium]
MPPPRRRRRPRRVEYHDLGGRIDLHGATRAEAREQLRDFLQEAVALGEHTVLVIHGKGTGTLARFVTAELDGSPHVRSHRTAPKELGGEGARVVDVELGAL